MKLNAYQFEQQLEKPLSPIYIISGDDILLKNDAIHLLRKKAKQAGFSERIRIVPEAGFDWESLYTILNANSLLAEKRIIEIDFRDHTPNKIAAPILESYANNPARDNLLIIDISKIDDKIAKSTWYKALEKAGIAVAIWPISREQLPQWIINRARKYKMQLPIDAANLLADYVEGNSAAAAQMLEKIYLLRPEKAIDSALLQTILADESRFTVFDFVEHLIAGDKTKALHILETLKNDGTEPTLILWSITRELRMLADLSHLLKQGSTYDQLFTKYRIFARRQSAVRKFLSKFNTANCWRLLSHAATIDPLIKGGAAGNPWEALQLFCLRCA